MILSRINKKFLILLGIICFFVLLIIIYFFTRHNNNNLCSDIICLGQTPECKDGVCVCNNGSCPSGTTCLPTGKCSNDPCSSCSGVTPECKDGVCVCNSGSCTVGNKCENLKCSPINQETTLAIFKFSDDTAYLYENTGDINTWGTSPTILPIPSKTSKPVFIKPVYDKTQKVWISASNYGLTPYISKSSDRKTWTATQNTTIPTKKLEHYMHSVYAVATNNNGIWVAVGEFDTYDPNTGNNYNAVYSNDNGTTWNPGLGQVLMRANLAVVWTGQMFMSVGSGGP